MWISRWPQFFLNYCSKKYVFFSPPVQHQMFLLLVPLFPSFWLILFDLLLFSYKLKAIVTLDRNTNNFCFTLKHAGKGLPEFTLNPSIFHGPEIALIQISLGSCLHRRTSHYITSCQYTSSSGLTVYRKILVPKPE